MKWSIAGRRLSKYGRTVMLFAWVTFVFVASGCKDKPLENFGSVTSFQLTSQTGEVFQSDSMKEKVWLVSFFFSRCKTICPPLMDFIKTVQDDAKAQDISLDAVSISVDPEHDTPEKLAAKHADLKADKNWTFLTGTSEDVRKVVVEGFKTHMGEQEILEGGMIEIGHGAKIMLIDGQGIIRGLFSADEMNKKLLLELANKLGSS